MAVIFGMRFEMTLNSTSDVSINAIDSAESSTTSRRIGQYNTYILQVNYTRTVYLRNDTSSSQHREGLS